MNGTLEFYDTNAEEYSRKTFGADMSHLRSHIIGHLPAGGTVLDLGCGSGRDAKAFSEMGYRVTAVDASEGMCQMAETNTGLKVRRMRFTDLDYTEEFDGVWACCSLLHAGSEELPTILGLVKRSLREDGVFFCCFKKGDFEGEREGRHYLDLNELSLRRYLEEAGFEVLEMWDEREPDRDVLWINAVSRISP